MKVKILCPVDYTPELKSTQLNISIIPPLGMATLVSYLRGRDVEVEQDDLNIKTHYDIYFKKEKTDLDVFNNRKKVMDYLSGKADGTIGESIGRIMYDASAKDIDLLLFTSVGATKDLARDVDGWTKGIGNRRGFWSRGTLCESS